MARMRTLGGLGAAVALSTLLGSNAIGPALHAAGGAPAPSAIHGMSAHDLQVLHKFGVTIVPISPQTLPPKVSAQQLEAADGLVRRVPASDVSANYVLYTDPTLTPRTLTPAERAGLGQLRDAQQPDLGAPTIRKKPAGVDHHDSWAAHTLLRTPTSTQRTR